MDESVITLLQYKCSCGHKGLIKVMDDVLNLGKLRHVIEEDHGESNLKVLLGVELEEDFAPWITCSVRHRQ